MRIFTLAIGAAIGLGSLNVEAQACNARGEYCGYPGWAANAFSSEDDRVPDYRWDDGARFGYLGTGYGFVAPYADARTYGYAPRYGRTYDRAPAYDYAAPGYEYTERRYRWREER